MVIVRLANLWDWRGSRKLSLARMDRVVTWSANLHLGIFPRESHEMGISTWPSENFIFTCNDIILHPRTTKESDVIPSITYAVFRFVPLWPTALWVLLRRRNKEGDITNLWAGSRNKEGLHEFVELISYASLWNRSILWICRINRHILTKNKSNWVKCFVNKIFREMHVEISISSLGFIFSFGNCRKVASI